MHELNEVAGGRRSWDVVSRGSDGGASPMADPYAQRAQSARGSGRLSARGSSPLASARSYDPRPPRVSIPHAIRGAPAAVHIRLGVAAQQAAA